MISPVGSQNNETTTEQLTVGDENAETIYFPLFEQNGQTRECSQCNKEVGSTCLQQYYVLKWVVRTISK